MRRPCRSLTGSVPSILRELFRDRHAFPSLQADCRAEAWFFGVFSRSNANPSDLGLQAATLLRSLAVATLQTAAESGEASTPPDGTAARKRSDLDGRPMARRLRGRHTWGISGPRRSRC